MNRPVLFTAHLGNRMPHVGGDEPLKILLRGDGGMYAPRMWG